MDAHGRSDCRPLGAVLELIVPDRFIWRKQSDVIHAGRICCDQNCQFHERGISLYLMGPARSAEGRNSVEAEHVIVEAAR